MMFASVKLRLECNYRNCVSSCYLLACSLQQKHTSMSASVVRSSHGVPCTHTHTHSLSLSLSLSHTHTHTHTYTHTHTHTLCSARPRQLHSRQPCHRTQLRPVACQAAKEAPPAVPRAGGLGHLHAPHQCGVLQRYHGRLPSGR
jgi:hypothetical protein